MKIIIETDHSSALSLHQAAGLPYPVIPPGENSAIEEFITTAGDPALIINQRGPTPTSPDHCCVLIAEDSTSADPVSEMLEFIDCIRRS